MRRTHSRRWRPAALWRLALPVLALAGCGSDGPARKETVPVKGQVYVDGQPPSSPIRIVCHDVKGMDQQQPTVSQTMTSAGGQFAIATYESGDGMPPGEYLLTFEWGELNLFSGQYGGPDKLNGRYSDPDKSDFRFTVESGKPLDLGRIDLTTK